MDRYLFGPTYKEHFACFRCRKAFKQPSEADLPPDQRPAPGETRVVLCPQCRTPMADMGRDWEAPRQSDEKQWKAIEQLQPLGFKWAGGPGPRPADVKDMETFLTPAQLGSEGERLLRKIRQRTRRSRRRT